MNLPVQLIVRGTVNRTVTSWEPMSARGHSRTLTKSADSAPHAPNRSESRSPFQGRVWSVLVAALNPTGGIQRVLCIVQCVRQTMPEHEIRAQLRFQLPLDDLQSHRKQVLKVRQVRSTIDAHCFTEVGQLPLVGAKDLDQDSTSSQKITPSQD